MIKTITLRSEAANLESKLEGYKANGWRVVSVQRGSAWTRIALTYSWTITLEKDDVDNSLITCPKCLFQFKDLTNLEDIFCPKCGEKFSMKSLKKSTVCEQHYDDPLKQYENATSSEDGSFIEGVLLGLFFGVFGTIFSLIMRRKSSPGTVVGFLIHCIIIIIITVNLY